MENIPLYNSIIIKGYIDYLENNYPNVNINELLTYSNINQLRVGRQRTLADTRTG